jgi:hypothetical protein
MSLKNDRWLLLTRIVIYTDNGFGDIKKSRKSEPPFKNRIGNTLATCIWQYSWINHISRTLSFRKNMKNKWQSIQCPECSYTWELEEGLGQTLLAYGSRIICPFCKTEFEVSRLNTTEFEGDLPGDITSTIF